MIQIYENWSWGYQQALDWMVSCKTQCIKESKSVLGVGSHERDVVTLGRHADKNDILNPDMLKKRDIEVFRVERGGGATLHGPGQVVLYPVMSLDDFGLSVPELTKLLEDVMIAMLSDFSIESHRLKNNPGVYVSEKKIGSIGFRVSEKIVTHGISLNVSNNLDLYSAIKTCKKTNAAITSITALLGEKISVHQAGRALIKHLKLLLNNL